MFRYSSLGSIALALGAWVCLAGPTYAQKGKGGGGGGGGARSAPARSAPARSAPAPRSAPARVAPAPRAPVAPRSVAVPKAGPGPNNILPAANAARVAPKAAPGKAPQGLGKGPQGLAKAPQGPGKGPQGNVAKQGNPNSKNWNANGKNWNRDDWNRNNYRGGYGYNRGYYDHDHNDNYWPFFAYALARDILGFGWGYGHYSPYAWSGYGSGYYGGGYYGGGYYDPGPTVTYRNAYYGNGNTGNGYAEPADGRVGIQVRVPDANAYVWVNGQSTTSRGTVRDFTSPPLEAGYEYTYTIRAAWDDNGELRTVQRQVPVTPGQGVVVDFSQAPPRPMQPVPN